MSLPHSRTRRRIVSVAIVDDDEHRTMLGEDCHQCHNPNSWAIWDFDHTEQTRFALDGKPRGFALHSVSQQAIAGEPESVQTM